MTPLIKIFTQELIIHKQPKPVSSIICHERLTQLNTTWQWSRSCYPENVTLFRWVCGWILTWISNNEQKESAFWNKLSLDVKLREVCCWKELHTLIKKSFHHQKNKKRENMAAKSPSTIYMLITGAAVQGSRMRKESYPLITVIVERIASQWLLNTKKCQFYSQANLLVFIFISVLILVCLSWLSFIETNSSVTGFVVGCFEWHIRFGRMCLCLDTINNKKM